jgi:hypothetical protein
MARTLRPVTPLAQSILASGKPAYIVAAEVGINYNRLLDYCDGRMEPTSVHRSKLSTYVEPASDDAANSTVAHEVESEPFDPIEFCACVTRMSTQGTSARVVLEVCDRLAEPLIWDLALANLSSVLLGWRRRGQIFGVRGHIDRVHKKRTGLGVQLRVQEHHANQIIALPVDEDLSFVLMMDRRKAT